MSLASSPIRISPFSRKQMTDGVTSFPKTLLTASGLEVSLLYLATVEYVVPRSIPTFMCIPLRMVTSRGNIITAR
jgi:hypothetical protein